MNIKNIMVTITTILVAVILVAGVLVPVIADNSGTRQVTHTLTNTGTSLIKGDVSEDYTVQWDSALPGMVKVNGNVTTVYFVAGNDATVSPQSKTVTVDLTYGELPTPTRTGYTFDGWYTSTQYTTEVTDETIVVGTQDKILYAKWVGNEYTITFNAGSGTVSPATKTVTFGQPYGELPVPEYTGHNFGGWFDSNDNVITSSTIVNIAADHTLDAEYTIAQYLVTFTTDGNGTVSTQSVTVDYGTSYTISSNTVTIDGTTVTATPTSPYVFDYWTPGTSGTVEGAMTFTANFVLPPVTLTFTAQSPGTVDVPSIADVWRGTQYVVADNTVVVGSTTVTASLPNGYYMTGWNIDQGVGTVSDAMTFTAEYELIEIASVSSSGSTTWFVTTDGKLFGCGLNTYGQQGDGTTTNVTTFTQRLSTETIANVYCSDNTTWALTTDGKLFGCGNNAWGQQGNDDTTTDVLTFTQRLSTETIANISCNAYATWALTTDGKLFGCGSGHMQGSGGSNKITSFTQRLSTETIKEVYSVPTAGTVDGSTWVITTDGKLFGCGANYGNQGTGNTSDISTFTQRLNTETIAQVSCSGSTTWAVTTDGKLFGCGTNASGQQGDGTTTSVTTFTQRLNTETIASVKADYDMTWAVTTDGKLFGCGENQSGQQGDGTTTDVTTFTQRLDTETVAKVFVGGRSDYGSVWAVTTDGKLFGCGDNTWGQQGSGTSGNNAKVTSFTQRLSTETIDVISTPIKLSSGGATWALTTDGKLFGCGENNSGQQSTGGTVAVKTFTQRGPPGSVNITTQLQQLSPQVINPIPLSPLTPFTPVPAILMNVTPSDIISTDYTFHAGGNDWMLCTVSTGVDQYALALYYAGLTEPLLWDEDVTLNFSNGSLTVSNGGNSYTMTYTSIFYKGNGDYILMDGSAYVKGDSQIIGFVMPATDSAIEVTGTVSSVEALSIADGTITTVDSGSVESAITDYDNVFQVSKVSATYDTDQTVDCNNIIVPKKVSYTETVEDAMMDAVLIVIPLVVIIGIILATLTSITYFKK